MINDKSQLEWRNPVLQQVRSYKKPTKNFTDKSRLKKPLPPEKKKNSKQNLLSFDIHELVSLVPCKYAAGGNCK